MPLSTTISQDKLKIFKMTNTGKNSADFGICFFAGALMQQFQKKACFVIISNDTDLDHVVNLLISQGCTAERVGFKKEKEVESIGTNQELSAIQLYCIHLVSYSKHRPSKKVTLLNSIKSKLKNYPELAEDIFESLIQTKALMIVENKVLYNDSKINEIAKLTRAST